MSRIRHYLIHIRNIFPIHTIQYGRGAVHLPHQDASTSSLRIKDRGEQEPRSSNKYDA